MKNYYSNSIAFGNAFIGWNYKVLTENLHTCTLAEGCDYVADKIHDEADREVVSVLDKILTESGYTRKKGDFNEGPSVRYYCGKSSHSFLISPASQYIILSALTPITSNNEECLLLWDAA